jgi:hypothetical protein
MRYIKIILTIIAILLALNLLKPILTHSRGNRHQRTGCKHKLSIWIAPGYVES